MVSAWILDKRGLAENEGNSGGRQGSLTRPSAKRLEAFLEQCRRDVQVSTRVSVDVVVAQRTALYGCLWCRSSECSGPHETHAVDQALPAAMPRLASAIPTGSLLVHPRPAQHLARLKHPLVLRLVSPLEETRTQMVFVTEAVLSSLADYMAACSGSAPPPSSGILPGDQGSPDAMRMGELELKHGVLQMADAIHFLHSGANMAHRGICPHALFIARSGG